MHVVLHVASDRVVGDVADAFKDHQDGRLLSVSLVDDDEAHCEGEDAEGVPSQTRGVGALGLAGGMLAHDAENGGAGSDADGDAEAKEERADGGVDMRTELATSWHNCSSREAQRAW